jgi:hypothetical protein
MMNTNAALLSIGTALLCSLSVSDTGHAIEAKERQHPRHLTSSRLNEAANNPTTQLSNAPHPCPVAGKGRTRTPCGTQRPGLEERAAEWSHYASTVFATTLTVMLSLLVMLAALSLGLIILAAWARRILG